MCSTVLESSAGMLVVRVDFTGSVQNTGNMPLYVTVTGDLAGFVGATYLRGVPVVQLPTSIVAMVDQLQACDTTGVTPMAHPLERGERLRADVVTESDRHELYQRNAPLVERDLYLVPKVIE